MKNKRQLAQFLTDNQKTGYPTKEMFLNWLVEFEETIEGQDIGCQTAQARAEVGLAQDNKGFQRDLARADDDHSKLKELIFKSYPEMCVHGVHAINCQLCDRGMKDD